METIKVNVERTSDGVYVATTNRGRLELFRFQKNMSGDCWVFYPFSGHRCYIKGDTEGVFPWHYFTRLAQSVYLITIGVEDYPEVQPTQKTVKLLSNA